jgi:hypothetical protein
MNKEDVVLLVQLLMTMKEILAQLDIAYEQRNAEKTEEIKKEIIDLQGKIARILQ